MPTEAGRKRFSQIAGIALCIPLIFNLLILLILIAWFVVYFFGFVMLTKDMFTEQSARQMGGIPTFHLMVNYLKYTLSLGVIGLIVFGMASIRRCQ